MSFPETGINPVPILPDGRIAMVSSGWGMRGSGMHSGLDIMFKRAVGEPAHGPNGSPGFFMPSGLPALSPLDGYVTTSQERFTQDGQSRGWGITVMAGTWEVFINHLVRGTQRVHYGDHVRAGDPLGEIGGSVGNQGPDALKHVHLGLLRNGVLVDPEPYFRRWEALPVPSEGGWLLALAGGLAIGWAVS